MRALIGLLVGVVFGLLIAAAGVMVGAVLLPVRALIRSQVK
jgi:hypothetical protein